MPKPGPCGLNSDRQQWAGEIDTFTISRAELKLGKTSAHPREAPVPRSLGPATSHEGNRVRPHDLVLTKHWTLDSQAGSIARITHLGFEVRVEVELEDGSTSVVQLARRSFNDLDIAVNDHVYLTLHGQSSRTLFEPSAAHESSDPQLIP